MKRLLLPLVLVVAACGGEEPVAPSRPVTPARTPATPAPSSTPKLSVPTTPHLPNRSTPGKCAGDGSYEQAIDCFRISSGFSFVLVDPQGVEAQGEMTRKTPGMERVHFRTSDGVSWIGEAKASGVVWSRNGVHEQAPPEITNRVWQRTTMVLDPQKKEGAPQLTGTEPLAGEVLNHYHFTNANSGEANDVWVSTRDGRITKWMAGASTLRLK